MDVVRGAIAWLASMVAACGDGAGGGGDDDGGIEPPTPVLELEPRISRTCSVISPTTEIGDGLTSDFALVTFEGRHHALTTRNDARIALAPLVLEPVTLGAPVWSTATAGWSHGAQAVPREGGGLVVVWPENDVDPLERHRIAIAMLDEHGAPIGTTRFVNRSVEVGNPQLVVRPGGYTLAWSDTAYDTGPRPSTWWVQLDAAGAPQAEPAKLTDGHGALVGHDDGYAVTWGAYEGDDFVARVVLLDSLGAPRTEVWTRPVLPDHHAYAALLTPLGPDLVISWTERYSPGLGDERGYDVVRFARMAADGTVGPIQRLQAPEIGVSNLNPTWARIDGALVLSWGRGDYIAGCGGCTSDYRMHLVQLDPVDLAPISNVVSFGGPSGLRSAPIATLDGRDFAYLLAIDRHARFDVAAAMVRCEAAP